MKTSSARCLIAAAVAVTCSFLGVGWAVPSGALASTGYRLLGGDGGVFAFGNASFHGSAASNPAQCPTNPLGRLLPGGSCQAMASTPDGGGYWLVASDGGVFAFGDVRFEGSLGGIHLAAPVIGIAANRAGSGYWLAASDGGVFALGGAPFLGSNGATHLNKPVFAIAAS